MELRAYQAYKKPDLPIHFWRTSTGLEVDFLLGDRDLALEIKGARRVHEGDIRSLVALIDDAPVKKCLIVSLEEEERVLQKGIEVVPWRRFIERLWSGEFC
jgi:predicted AAA+ superfamily ATPase